MAGRGPAPKPGERRAGHSKGPDLHIVIANPAPQPKLPMIYLADPITGKRKRFEWPARTREWWQMWANSPLSSGYTEIDWSELLDTALIHAKFWSGELKLAGELRLRVGKFGATPEDRARLRIATVAAEEAEARPAKPSARDRRGGLSSLPGGKPPAKKAPARRRTLTG